MEMANPNARVPGETTPEWLERLINIGAPTDIRANVQQLLVAEAGNNCVVFIMCYFLVILCHRRSNILFCSFVGILSTTLALWIE